VATQADQARPANPDRVGRKTLSPARPARRRGRRRQQWGAYLYLLPSLAVLAIFLLVPAGQAVWISLFRWDGLSPATWSGIGNYTDLVTDSTLRSAFVHSFVLILFYAGIPVVVGLLLSAVMSRATRLRGLGFFRVVLFLPQVVASVVVATAWLAMYGPDGLVNQVLRLIGLGSLTRAWLGDFSTALPAVGLIGTWVGIGLCLVLFLTGIGQINPELFEAARLDGAGLWHEFIGITLPALRGQIAVALTLTVIAALKTFDLVYVATSGGPGTSTTVPGFLAYQRAFELNQVGSASALGVALTVVILVVTLLISRLQGSEENA